MQSESSYVLDDAWSSGVIKRAILQMHIGDRRVWKSLKVHRVMALAAFQILHLKIAQHRRVFSVRAFLIIEIHRDSRVGHFTNRDVAEKQIFQHASAHSIVLEPQTMIEARAV